MKDPFKPWCIKAPALFWLECKKPRTYTSRFVIIPVVVRLGRNPDLKVYPNPAQQSFTVEFTQENFDLIITDLTGRNIYEQKNMSGKTQIASKDFTSGIYFVQAANGKNIFSEKIIITK